MISLTKGSPSSSSLRVLLPKCRLSRIVSVATDGDEEEDTKGGIFAFINPACEDEEDDEEEEGWGIVGMLSIKGSSLQEEALRVEESMAILLLLIITLSPHDGFESICSNISSIMYVCYVCI